MRATTILLALAAAAPLDAQSPFADAPTVLELRTHDASFAASVQKALRSVARDPRGAGGERDEGSIRVCLRYLANGVPGFAEGPQRACETSVGPALAPGVFAELELDPAVALAAFAPDVAALREVWAPRANGALAASGWGDGAGGPAIGALLDVVGSIATLRATVHGDPRTRSCRAAIELRWRDGCAAQRALARLRPARSVPATPLADAAMALVLNLGSEQLVELLQPLFDRLHGAAAAQSADSPPFARTDALEFLRQWNGTLCLHAPPELAPVVLTVGARDEAAMWKWFANPAALAKRAEDVKRRGVDASHAVEEPYRGVPILRQESTRAAPRRTSALFAAAFHGALWSVTGGDALASLHTAIDAASAGAPPRTMADGELVRLQLALPFARSAADPTAGTTTVRASVVRRDDGLSIDFAMAPGTGR